MAGSGQLQYSSSRVKLIYVRLTAAVYVHVEKLE